MKHEAIKINENTYQIGIFIDNEDYYIDYIFCEIKDIQSAELWAKNRIKDIQLNDTKKN